MIAWGKLFLIVLGNIWLFLELIHFFLLDNAIQVSNLGLIGLLTTLFVAGTLTTGIHYFESSQANRRNAHRSFKFLVFLFSLLLPVYLLAQLAIFLATASTGPIEVIVNRVAIFASCGGFVLGIFWSKFIWPFLRGHQLDE